jgi:hypothetical protein
MDPSDAIGLSPITVIFTRYWRDDSRWIGTHEARWGRVEGGFAGVGWSDQVRLYYFQDGELVVSAQNDKTWQMPAVV